VVARREGKDVLSVLREHLVVSLGALGLSYEKNGTI
jgi:hypothetical protein